MIQLPEAPLVTSTSLVRPSRNQRSVLGPAMPVAVRFLSKVVVFLPTRSPLESRISVKVTVAMVSIGVSGESVEELGGLAVMMVTPFVDRGNGVI
ncbi:hypothetical protein D3C81_1585350 [compost metagenome]